MAVQGDIPMSITIIAIMVISKFILAPKLPGRRVTRSVKSDEPNIF